MNELRLIGQLLLTETSDADLITPEVMTSFEAYRANQFIEIDEIALTNFALAVIERVGGE